MYSTCIPLFGPFSQSWQFLKLTCCQNMLKVTMSCFATKTSTLLGCRQKQGKQTDLFSRSEQQRNNIGLLTLLFYKLFAPCECWTLHPINSQEEHYCKKCSPQIASEQGLMKILSLRASTNHPFISIYEQWMWNCSETIFPWLLPFICQRVPMMRNNSNL